MGCCSIIWVGSSFIYNRSSKRGERKRFRKERPKGTRWSIWRIRRRLRRRTRHNVQLHQLSGKAKAALFNRFGQGSTTKIPFTTITKFRTLTHGAESGSDKICIQICKLCCEVKRQSERRCTQIGADGKRWSAWLYHGARTRLSCRKIVVKCVSKTIDLGPNNTDTKSNILYTQKPAKRWLTKKSPQF